MFLLDTSTLNAYLKYPRLVRKNQLERAAELEAAYERIQELPQLTFSLLTQWEIERWLRQQDAGTQLRAFSRLCAAANVLPITQPLIHRSASDWAALRVGNETLGDIDTLILSSAGHWGLTLVTEDIALLRCAGIVGVPAESWTGSTNVG